MNPVRPLADLIKVTADPTGDGENFVGVVEIGEVQAYRTLRRFRSEETAQAWAVELLRDALGSLLAGEEWLRVKSDLDRVPRRIDLFSGRGGELDGDEPGA